MTATKIPPPRRTGAAWMPAWAVAVALAGLADHLGLLDLPVWLPLPLGVLGVGLATLATGVSDTPMRALPHRAVAVISAAAWLTWVWATDLGQAALVALGGWAAVTALLEFYLAAGSDEPDLSGLGDRRPQPVRDWEGLLRRLSKKEVTVRKIVPWDVPGDGQQVHGDLPEDMTVKDLAGICDRIASAPMLKLPNGCVVRALEGPHQAAFILDVMLRDCLADTRTVEEDTTPASINDEFDVATAPRGEALTVCLRQKSMVVGGTVGSGKTTLLHRIIMFLARCVDALIWVVDFNGGGVAAPWVGPWARGEADKPAVDWVAEDEYEAAVLLAVARKIMKDRKTGKEAMRRKRAANTTVLPVDAHLPAVVVITDEGGEVRQAVGLLGTIVDEGIARLAQIARAEGGRVVMSILRGTGDLLGKGLRAVVGIRICLRMEEEVEYDHVLGKNPGRARLLHIGSAYVYRTDTDYRPVLARTVDVDLDSIQRHAVATAHLRPNLDDRARRIAAQLTVREVLDGRDPRDHIDIARHPVMRDVEAGRAYEGRWDRKAAMLAELRGEDLPDDDDEPAVPPIPDRPTVAPPGSAAERLLLGTGITLDRPAGPAPKPAAAGGRDDAVARHLLSEEHLALVGVRGAAAGQPQQAQDAPSTAREMILLVLSDAHPDRLTAAQVHAQVVERGVEVSPQRVHELLKTLVSKGQARGDGAGYELARDDR